MYTVLDIEHWFDAYFQWFFEMFEMRVVACNIMLNRDVTELQYRRV